jgi:hypothetical protein
MVMAAQAHDGTQRTQASVDALVEEVVRDAANCPDSALTAALRLPIAAYAVDIEAAADQLRKVATPDAVKRAVPGRVWADGWRQQLPGSWPYYPDEPHYCYRTGHWTRDSRLVLACCGLDAT